MTEHEMEIKVQACAIAANLKAMERREPGSLADERLEAARDKENISFGISVDDKLITVKTTWTRVREASDEGLTELLFKIMTDRKNDA